MLDIKDGKVYHINKDADEKYEKKEKNLQIM